MGLTALDIIVLVLVLGGAVQGAIKGFVTEVLSLVAWVFIVFALRVLQVPLTNLLSAKIATYGGATVLAFVLIAGVTYLGGRWVANAIGKRTRTSILGPVDRALGFGFGGLKGLVFASLVFLLIVLVIDTTYGGASQRPEWITKSRTYPLLKVTSAGIADFVDRRRQGKAMFGNDPASADNESDSAE
ncbi:MULTISPECIES: CvpA family protein [Sphingomonas]|uniref:CvpA family protein n=1 Tax=Sphingomonas TaxID=13687 RepID=UPI00082D548B|nr:CvpA family protein [Sphingomonas sp. CCH10-B3]MBA3878152.1 colicin V production protein [Sphingobium sp.]